MTTRRRPSKKKRKAQKRQRTAKAQKKRQRSAKAPRPSAPQRRRAIAGDDERTVVLSADAVRGEIEEVMALDRLTEDGR